MKKKSFKIIGLIFSICFCLTLLGVAYAYFEYYKTGEEEIVFNGGKIDVLFTSKTGSNVSLSGMYPMSDEEGLENGLEYEFILTGFNESENDVSYRIYMDNSTDLDGKTRFNDTDIKIAVFKNEELVLEPSIIENYSEPGVFFDVIKQGSSATSPLEDTFKIKLWVADHVRITDTACNYNNTCISQSDFPNYYFNKIVKVEANFDIDSLGYLTYDANGGSNTPSKTSLATQAITDEKPVIEGKAFLGWSSSKVATEAEYLSGDTYTGRAKVLYAVYEDVRNVMNTFPTVITDVKNQITEAYFINETKENIETRYNAASIKADLTYNSQGSVKGWLEEDYLDDATSTQYYKLFVASDGVTYLNTGNKLFYEWSNIQLIDFTNVDTSMVTTFSNTFYKCENLITINMDSFNTSNVFLFGGMFQSCISLVEVDVSHFDTSNASGLMLMFSSCSSLKNIDLSNFNTSKCGWFNCMFTNCSSLVSLDLSSFDTLKAQSIERMFDGCKNLKTLNISSFNTSNVTSIYQIFNNCEKLESLDVSHFDTSKATDMSFMFSDCMQLSSLNVSNFNTSSVENMRSMFSGCINLRNLDVTNFDTSQVTNMSSMFYNCSKLNSLDVSSFNTENVTDMSSMFYHCSNLLSIDVAGFDTSNVTSMNAMFLECINLKLLDLRAWDVSSLEEILSMFDGCRMLETIYCNSDWSTTANITEEMDAGMFSGCVNLVGAVSYNSSKTNITMANYTTGYFTQKIGHDLGQ